MKEMKFDYLIKKIENAEFSTGPFKHLYIPSFFSDEHFKKLTNAPEIRLNIVKDDFELFSKLFESGYKIIGFPGTITDKNKYIEWHRNKSTSNITNTSCVGFGVVLRLEQAKSQFVQELREFLSSFEFQNAIAARYDIKLEDCNYDAGIQKYLDGYEISPHPDVRRKALTYMVNINPSETSERESIHTQYLKFTDQYRYIRSFWEGNSAIDRCWVPWSWCKTEYKQTENNSLVLFSPNNDTLHAVKADYDHLNFQRTQLYGNLWYEDSAKTIPCRWEDLVIEGSPVSDKKRISEQAKQLIPRPLFDKLKSIKNNLNAKKKKEIGKRDY